MHILTIYTKDAGELLVVLDEIAAEKGSIKLLALDPNRLYNDANHFDDTMTAATFITNEDHESVVEFINRDDVFVCTEDPNDWFN